MTINFFEDTRYRVLSAITNLNHAADMEPKLFNTDILQIIGKKLQSKQQTIAISESVTSGLLQFAFSNIKDAEKFYHGGITAYNIGQKYKHLNVEAIHAIEVNCVSQKIADEMAINVTSLFNSDWGIGITGYASASAQSNNEVFAYFTIAFRQSVKLFGMLNPPDALPPEVQLYYTTTVLEKLKEAVSE